MSIELADLSPEVLEYIAMAERAAAEKAKAELLAQQKEEAERYMNLSDIMKARGTTAIETVKRVLVGANVQPKQKIGNAVYYDRDEVVKAFIEKDSNILNFYGLLHMVKGDGK